MNFLPLDRGGGARRRRRFFIAAYLVHARHTENPALDLTLFRIPTFRASVLGGFTFRLGIGALPFLLPLMLQVGFGKTPFQSGLITFASAMGAMGMKMAAVDVPAPLRLPHHPGGQCHHQRRLPRHLRRLHAGDAGRGDARRCCWSAGFSARCNSPASTPSPMPRSNRRG